MNGTGNPPPSLEPEASARHSPQHAPIPTPDLAALMLLMADSTVDFAIITVSPTGLITSWNRGAECLFGYPQAEVLGHPFDIIFLPQDRANGVPAIELHRAREYGRAADERWHQRKDGSRLYCSGVVTRLGTDNHHGFAKIVRDHTTGKRVEREHEVLLRHERLVRTRAQAANQLKDEFLAVMSHELKHPLNLIYVNAELLAHLPEVRQSATGSRAAQTIQRAVLGQAKIIDDLLDLSRVHTGKLTLNRRKVDLAQIVANVVDSMQIEAQTAGVTLEPPNAPQPATVMGDEVRLEQIIWNLLSNALKFTPSGGRVRIGLNPEGRYIRLDVSDTGCGISQAILPRIFEMFGQAENHTTRRGTGLGVGLALVRQLSQLHGGRVKAFSEGEGRGSTFSVWLPQFATAATQPHPRAAPAPEGAPSVLSGLRLLLVDDALDTLEAFGCLLELEGAVVTLAESGHRALDAAAGREFDLILSDLGMPNMDGHELLERLRRQPNTATVPAIALTGFARTQDIRRALEAGFAAHLGKPVQLDALVAIVEKLGVKKKSR